VFDKGEASETIESVGKDLVYLLMKTMS